ncbi:sugar ABC transporter permease [bacterium]|nr:sugar ABC transporter permease [bacterium]
MAKNSAERISFKKDLAALPFLLPFMAIFLVYIAWPLVYSFYLSLLRTDIYSSWYDRFGTMRFVGLQNYIEILQDPVFLFSILLTFIYAILTIFPTMALSLFLAITLNRKTKGFGIFRSGFFIPNVFDIYVVGVIWLFLYNPNAGLFVKIADMIGLDSLAQQGFLNNPKLTLPCVALAMVLKNAGFGMILFLTALNNISTSIFEAAEVDGATKWQQLVHVTVPLLRPIILFLSITGMVGTLNAFSEIYAMTDNTGGASIQIAGHTLQSGRISGYHLFRVFDDSYYGQAAAISFVLLAIALVIAYFNFKFLSPKES